MARSIDCKCEYNFTCGHCLRNAKPYMFNGIPVTLPLMGVAATATYQISYTIPGRGTVCSRGHTEEGKRQIMAAVLRAGGYGTAIKEN